MSSKFTKRKYIDWIKLNLTGYVLELEIPDETIGKYVDLALQEVQRFIDETRIISCPFSSCIDLTDWEHSAIVKVYRTEGLTGDGSSSTGTSDVDPMYAQTWMAFTAGGNYYNMNNYLMNYLSYNTLLQMRNTVSTDLAFREDKHDNKLYINTNYDKPKTIAVEYIPLFKKVEDVTSDYWIDILKRLSLALTKVALGRIRTRFTQSNALWQDDGQQILQEGTEELKELRELLRTNSTYFYILD